MYKPQLLTGLAFSVALTLSASAAITTLLRQALALSTRMHLPQKILASPVETYQPFQDCGMAPQ